MNASSKNQSLGTIICGELPKLHKNGFFLNTGNLLKLILHLLPPLGGGGGGVN